MNEDYLEYLLSLNQKVKFIGGDEMALSSAAYQDMEPVVEKLRLKAVAKVREFLLQKIYQLRRPRTNIQIIQQNVLLRFKYFVTFLKEHGGHVYAEVRSEYIKTTSRVLTQHFKSYLGDIERMHQAIATKHDVLGSQKEEHPTFSSLFGSSTSGGTPKSVKTVNSDPLLFQRRDVRLDQNLGVRIGRSTAYPQRLRKGSDCSTCG